MAHSQVADTFLWCVQIFLALLTPRGREKLSSACHLPRQYQSQSLSERYGRTELALGHKNELLAAWLCRTPAQGCERQRGCQREGARPCTSV